MPLVHECNWLHCHNVIPSDKKFCEYHKQLNDKRWQQQRDSNRQESDKFYNIYKRDKQANTFYHSEQWTKVRDFVKSRDMMTSGLSGRVLNNHDYVVDHIVPRKYCNDPYDVSNLWLLSREEHNRKTRYESQLPIAKLRTLNSSDWKRILSHNFL